VRTGDHIRITAGLETADRWLDHAGTKHSDGTLVTSGGRVAAVVARADTAAAAQHAAYAGLKLVSFDGMQYRRDIGAT